MRRVSQTLASLAFLLTAVNLIADLDPCPTRERDFNTSAANATAGWATISSKLEAVRFNRAAFEAQYRAVLEAQAVKDVTDTIASLNTTRKKDDQILVTTTSLKAAAHTKVTRMIALPEIKQRVDLLIRDAENTFQEAKAKKRLELAQQKQQLDKQIDDARGQLHANCQYDFPNQLKRIVLQLFQIDMRVEGGTLKIGDFKTDVPTINAGKVTSGNHHLMDLPVIKNGNVEIGGTNIGPLAVIAAGQFIAPAVNALKEIKIDIPQIDVPVKIGNGNDGKGLNMQVGSWKF
jgi:hypothetical protein